MSGRRTQVDPRRAHYDMGAPRRDRRSDRARPRELDINPFLPTRTGSSQSMRGWRAREQHHARNVSRTRLHHRAEPRDPDIWASRCQL